ncbi:MAG: efflux RND transporter periplasmic adaptor subunit [Acidobacteriia bacterium]|nr:efflux RND transporter periplasmic adaptor subunit [Terriglobia bacterium]
MERKLRNRIVLFLLLAGVIAYVLVRMSGRQPVAKIAAVRPARENLVASISSNGKVEPVTPFVMRAQLATFVDKVYALEGQSLHKGQPILELDVKDAAAQLAQARASLLRAQDDLRAARAGGRSDEAARVTGDLSHAQAERDRLLHDNEALKRLVAQQAATKDELAANEVALTRAQSEYNRLAAAKQEFARQVLLDAQRAALQVEQARSEADAFENRVRESRVVAPVDGTLYSLPVRAGDFVRVGDLLGEMADLRQVRVRAFIDEPELGSLAPEEPVIITWDALPSRSWQGRTTVIPKQVVARGTRSVGELLCAVNNDKLELLPNTNVNVRINAKERLHVLAVPRGAVELEGGQRYVFVVKDNELSVGKKRLEKRQVQVGIASPTSYEITGGLQEGEYVALPGDVDLKDGMAVRVVNLE